MTCFSSVFCVCTEHKHTPAILVSTQTRRSACVSHMCTHRSTESMRVCVPRVCSRAAGHPCLVPARADVPYTRACVDETYLHTDTHRCLSSDPAFPSHGTCWERVPTSEPGSEDRTGGSCEHCRQQELQPRDPSSSPRTRRVWTGCFHKTINKGHYRVQVRLRTKLLTAVTPREGRRPPAHAGLTCVEGPCGELMSQVPSVSHLNSSRPTREPRVPAAQLREFSCGPTADRSPSASHTSAPYSTNVDYVGAGQ